MAMTFYQELDELRARVAALEAGTTCPHIISSHGGTSYCDLALQTAAAQPDPQGPTDEELDAVWLAARWGRPPSNRPMTDHPIVPSPELIQEWENKYEGHMPEWIIRHVAYEAAKWGADQELEACCNHIRNHQWGFIKHLNDDWIHRAVDLKQARRPKPQEPTDEDLDAIWFASGSGVDGREWRTFARTVLARWGRP